MMHGNRVLSNVSRYRTITSTTTTNLLKGVHGVNLVREFSQNLNWYFVRKPFHEDFVAIPRRELSTPLRYQFVELCYLEMVVFAKWNSILDSLRVDDVVLLNPKIVVATWKPTW